MKTIKRRAFCKAAAAAVAGVLAPHAAAEALLPQAAQAVVGSAVPEDYYSFAFRSDHSETDLSHDFYYTDAFFDYQTLKISGCVGSRCVHSNQPIRLCPAYRSITKPCIFSPVS